MEDRVEIVLNLREIKTGKLCSTAKPTIEGVVVAIRNAIRNAVLPTYNLFFSCIDVPLAAFLE